MPVRVFDQINETIDPKHGSKYIGWMDCDLQFLANQKGLAKAAALLERRGLDLDIVLMSSRMLNPDVKDPDIYLRKAIEKVTDPVDRTVIVFTNNVTSPRRWIPLTAWIMVHRIGHIFQAGRSRYSGFPVLTAWNEFEDEFWRGLRDVKQMILTDDGYLPGHDGTLFHSMMATDDMAKFCNYLLTCRSARRKTIANALDPTCELLAQFVINGKVTLNRTADIQLNTTLVVGEHRDDFLPLNWAPKADFDRINQKIEDLEMIVNAKLEAFVKELKQPGVWKF